MLLRIVIPMINPSLRGGTLVTWHKEEGDIIGYGDDLCTIALDDFAIVRRTGRATLLSGRKMSRQKSDVESRSGRAHVPMVVTASDRGVLARVIKAEGTPVGVGDLVAVAATDEMADPGTPESWEKAPLMRVVANIGSSVEEAW